jgi:protein involved in polysaccharide export with SLBB domain
MLAMVLCGSAGCNSLTKNALRPCEIPIEAIPESRSRRVPIDHRHLGAPIEHEHRVMAGDVLGVYIADIVGKRDELPQVSYPSFRTKNAPIEPFVGLPFKVESDGTLHLPYVDAIHVEGLTIPDVREAIIHTYVADKKLIKPGRDNVAVSLITPKYHRIYVVRQDTRYNVPGLQAPDQFEISRRWSGTTLYLEPKEASVLTSLMMTGGLPGIDAMNEIWVMKGVPEHDLETACLPIIEKLEGPTPIMLSKEDSKLVRIPLHHTLGEALPFSKDDVVLGNGDVVFLPRRDGDTFMTGGMLPAGRFPLPRDRDLEILEAIAISTGANFGPAGGSRSPNFKGGGGGLIPPTDVVIVRRISETEQYKICVDLKKCLDDPTQRVRIAPGDLIVLKFKGKELAGNLALNLFNLNFTLSRVLGNGPAIVQ